MDGSVDQFIDWCLPCICSVDVEWWIFTKVCQWQFYR